MVAIVAGAGLGLLRSSGSVAGSLGLLGQASLGRAADNVYLNAANGNLVIQNNDEVLLGVGSDDRLARTYNSLGSFTNPFGAGQGWAESASRKVSGLSGTVNTAGSSVTLTDWDGSDVVFAYDASANGGAGGYTAKEDGGAFALLTFNASANQWTYRDGSRHVTEIFDAANGGRILTSTDNNGNALTFSYDATSGLLTRITTQDGEFTTLSYNGSNRLASIVTSRHADAAGNAALTNLTRVYYGYDTSGRLATVKVDLSPNDNATTDGNVYVTTYGYDGTSNRVSSISQTDGSLLAIGYTLLGATYRVTSLTQTAASGVTRKTTIGYDTTNLVTTVTDPQLNATKLAYDSTGRLLQITAPPAASGGVSQITQFGYDTNGDLLTVTAPDGTVTTSTYDSKGNVTRRQDMAGNVVTRTYGANNELLTETRYVVPTAANGTPAETLPQTTQYFYDSKLNLTYVIGAAGDVTQYVYNALGEQVSVLHYTSLASAPPLAGNVAATITSSPGGNVVPLGLLGGTATSVQVGTLPAHGTISYDASHTEVIYTAAPGYSGTDSFTYTASNANGTATATVNLNVLPAPPPVANPVQVTINGNSVNTPILVALSGGAASGIRITTGPAHGTATVGTDGTSIIYTPTAGYSGADTLQYVALNGSAPASAAASVSINVAAGLTLSNQAVTTRSGVATIIVPAYFELNAGYKVKTNALTQPAHGTAKTNADGSITYTSVTNYAGTDSFQFTLNDGKGGIATATVNLTVQSALHGFAPDVFSAANVNTPLTFTPALTDTTAQVIAVGTPSFGAAAILNADGSITYVPPEDYSGKDSFTYTARNSAGATFTATVNISVLDAPLAQRVSVSTPQNTAISFVPIFSDPNGLPASIVGLASDSDEFGGAIPIPSGVTIGADGQTITYTPPANFTGIVTFRYVVSDGSAQNASALVVINVTAPAAAAAPVTATTTPGTPVTFKPSVVGTITAVGAAAHGSTKLNPDGSITYRPDDFSGTDSFTYTVNNAGVISTATATVAVYDAPTTNSISATAQLNTPLTITPTITDPNGLTATIVRIVLDVDANGNTIPLKGTAVISADGKSIIYTPPTNFGGVESFRYVVSDGRGADATAVVSLKVVAPLALPMTTSVGFNSQNNPIAISGPPNATLVLNGAQPQHGTVTLSGGTFLYTPNAGYAGPDSFQYAFNSPVGTSTPGLVTINVNPAAPRAANVSASVAYGSPSNIVALSLSGGAAASVTITTQPLHGTVTVNGTSAIYTPAADYFGPDVFEYSVSNGGGTSTAQVQMLVRAPAATTTLSSASIDAWIARIADKSNVERLDTAYDFRGNVSSVTSYGRTLSTGLGDTTSDVSSTLYVYDQFGNLLSRQPVGQPQNGTAAETFVYDGLGRTTSSTDLGGVVTNIRFNDAASTTVVSLVNGLTRTSTYDLAGELINYTEAGSGVATSSTTYKYDSLGRPRMVTDPTGQTSQALFDNVSRKVADILPDGTITEYVYNSDDLLVETIGYANKLSSAQLASLVDSSGNPTNVTLASVRPVADPANDRYAWKVYDSGHRLVETIDASGAATILVYDGKSRLVSTTRYANRIDAATLAGFKAAPPTSVVSPNADSANDRTTRAFYDAQDRVVGTLDGEGFLTRTIYDGAGQKIETIAYASPVKASLRAGGAFADLVANVTATTNANDIHDWFVYDQRGLLRAAIDGEGDTTRYHYDALGNLDQKITGQKLDPAVLLATRPTLASLPVPSGPAVETTSYTYNLYGQVLTATLAVGGVNRVTVNSYDSLRRLVSTTVAQGTADAATQTLRYDLRGRVTGRLSGIGSAALAALGASPTQAQIDTVYATYGTTYVYDSADRMVSQTTPDGSGAGGLKSLYYYDKDGRLVYAIDPLGEVVEYRYDTFGERTDTIVHGGRLTSLTGLNGGLVDANITSAVAGIANAAIDSDSHADFNLLGEVADSKDPLQATTTYSYNAFGQLVTTIAPLAGAATVQTSSTYDRRGLLLTSTADSAAGGLGLVATNLYDAFGRAVSSTDASGRSRAMVYDRAGRAIRSVTDPNGLALAAQSIYDANGNVVATIDPNNKITRYVYDESNRQIYAVDATGDVTATTYDNQGRVASMRRYVAAIAPATLGTLPNMIVAGNVTSNVATSTADLMTTFSYDADGHVAQTVTNPGGLNLTTINTYDKRGLLVATTDAAGAVTHFVYDGAGRRIFAVDGAGDVTATTWDASGRVLATRTYAAVIPANVLTTLPRQLAAGDVTSKVATSTNDEVTNYVYDLDGRMRYAIDAATRVCEYVYDLAGNLIHKTEYATAIAAASSYTLSSVQGQLVVNGADRTTRTIFDTLNRAAFVIDAEGGVTGLAYDGAGNVVKTVQYAAPFTALGDQALSDMRSWATANANPHDRISRDVFDMAGRRVYTVDAEGYVCEYRYDAAGRVTSHIKYAASYSVGDGVTQAGLKAQLPASIPGDAEVTSFAYDAAGRVSDSFDGMGAQTHTVYDGEGRATDVTMAYLTTDAATTRTVYDAAGRVASVTRAFGAPEATTTSYTYDGMGRVKIVTDGLNHTTRFDYDAVGHVVTRTVQLDASTNAVTRNQYDAFGNLVKVTDPNGNSGFFYFDKLNRQVLQIDPLGYATATAYSRGDQAISLTHYATATSGAAVGAPPTLTTSAKDAVTRFGRDRLDRLTSISDAETASGTDKSHTESYVLDAFGNRVQVTNKLGGVTVNAYDRRGLLISETLPINSVDAYGNVEAASVVNTYAYDARGNQVQKIEAANLGEQRTTLFVYDKADRLFQTIGDPVQALGSSPLGGSTGANAMTDFLPAATAPKETRKYDARGNVIEVDDANGARAFAWYDDLNRKIADLDAAGTLRTFAYDANSNALKARVYGDPVAAPANPGGTPPAPVNANNFRETANSYDFANRLISSNAGTALTGAWNGSSFATASIQLVTRYAYDALGNLIQQTDPNGNNSYSWYDKRGKKTAQLDAAGYLTTYQLDQDGNVLTETRFATRYTGTVSLTTAPSVAAGPDDRITIFTYDKNGRRLTETRKNLASFSVSNTGVLSQNSATVATVTYTYNGLGEVTRKTEATGDYTDFAYDAGGRQVSQTTSAFTDFATNGQVQRQTQNYYDGLNNLTRMRVGAASGPAASDRYTLNTYGTGGRLASSVDAAGFAQSYAYDAVGNTVSITYNRLHSDGSTTQEAQIFSYDALGRSTSQGIATFDGTNWVVGDRTQVVYDTYGEMVSRGINGGAQESFAYDNAGRLFRSTQGDGIVKLYVSDANGNQTLAITSTGTNLSGYTSLGAAIAAFTNNGAHTIDSAAIAGVALTISAFDGRNMAVEVRAPFRELDVNASGTTDTALIDTRKTYNAFGEVTSQTDARGNVTRFVYNTIGKVVQTISPQTNATDESGAISRVTPTENDFYDASGRLVGVLDANNHPITRQLLAGTGYGGSDATVLAEFHADGGVKRTGVDVFGDARTQTNELGFVTSLTYDAMDRVIEVDHARRSDGTQLADYYAYDNLGQRIVHYNNQFFDAFHGTAQYEKTDYDAQGRVVSQLDFAGRTTSYSYAYNANLAASGLGTFGGWTKTTINTSGLTSSDSTDYFNHLISRTDFGGHIYSYSFDAAGRLNLMTSTAGQKFVYSYFNTGRLASVADQSLWGTGVPVPNQASDLMMKWTTYGYDVNGNRVSESLSQRDTGYQAHTTINRKTTTSGGPGPIGGTSSAGFTTSTTYTFFDTTGSYEAATATYDELNRMTFFSDAGLSGQNPASINYEYDAVGNERHTLATYKDLTSGAMTTQDYWFRYDSLNRFVITQGQLSGTRGAAGTTIVTGTTSGGAGNVTTGTALTWDVASQRHSASGPGGNETYTYTSDGYLQNVSIDGILRATDQRDALGRVTAHNEYSANGAVAFSRNANYDNVGNVTSDSTSTRQSDGSLLAQFSSYNYGLADAFGGYNGAYQGGAVTHSATSTYKNGTFQTNSDSKNIYVWWDGVKQQEIDFKPDITKSTINDSKFVYDINGYLTGVFVHDGNLRQESYTNDLFGQVINRIETNSKTLTDPRERYYYFNGIRVGDNGNNGPTNTDYSTAISDRSLQPNPNNDFKLGFASPYADFSQSYVPIDPNTDTAVGMNYTASGGDTLQSIAQAVWGDASLWYLIADANGLNGSETLVAGQALMIPNKVTNVHSNSTTFQPYNPNQMLGDVQPTTPVPQPSKHGCGIVGMILMTVISVAVSFLVPGLPGFALLPSILQPIVQAAATSIITQGIGVATGLQDKFSWSGVALAAIGAGVTEGLDSLGKLKSFAKFQKNTNPILFNTVKAGIGNLITQGIGVATGLQNKFDWAGVGASAAAAGVTTAVSMGLTKLETRPAPQGSDRPAPEIPKTDAYINDRIAGMAGTIAEAAVRSLIDGSDFGDNVVSGLAQFTGETIGNAIGSRLQAALMPPTDSEETTQDSDNAPTADQAIAAIGTSQQNLHALDGLMQFNAPPPTLAPDDTHTDGVASDNPFGNSGEPDQSYLSLLQQIGIPFGGGIAGMDMVAFAGGQGATAQSTGPSDSLKSRSVGYTDQADFFHFTQGEMLFGTPNVQYVGLSIIPAFMLPEGVEGATFNVETWSNTTTLGFNVKGDYVRIDASQFAHSVNNILSLGNGQGFETIGPNLLQLEPAKKYGNETISSAKIQDVQIFKDFLDNLPPPIPTLDPRNNAVDYTSYGPPSALSWSAAVTPAFAAKVEQVANDLKTNPDWLMGVMKLESGFSPSIQNQSGQHYYGLIQLYEKTIQSYGLTVDAYRNLSGVDQLDYAEKYLKEKMSSRNMTEIPSLPDAYALVLAPAHAGQPNDTVFYTDPSKEYKFNMGLDTNHDGQLTKAEAAGIVKARMIEGLKKKNVRHP